ncbi:site-specific integrase [Pseudomonas sp. KnCO4]|uniref:site-specific integrase n=1 Tax=Pseudomonas sp. KnCO4 TaxID=3381355 RepID=UPI003877A4A6
MSYFNPRHEGRLLVMPVLPNAFATLHVYKTAVDSIQFELDESDGKVAYLVEEVGGGNDRDVFHFPFLFYANGDSWHEANDYLLSLLKHKPSMNRRTDDVRRQASKLLDYLLFCEDKSLDWLDFSGARPSLRPTYKYFYHLINQSGRSNAVVNQYTSAIYNFFKYVSVHWHEIDMKRVDTVKHVKIVVRGVKGSKVIDVEKRSQTTRARPVSPVSLGFVREDGEDLRPLSNLELRGLLTTIVNEKQWSTIERLILLTSLMTGARKQTVLTLRLRHLQGFSEDKLLPEGAYKVHAGPGTGIDTKFDKPQDLYFPKQLADELTTLANSPMMRRRREKFRAHVAANFGMSISDEDMYLFLSDQGNCYYMAKNDPRYMLVKSPQTGQVTETIKRKLLQKAFDQFPKDFSYHWLRATFAYQVYQRLQVLVDKGAMRDGEVIDFVQSRMHHESRETTEHYLKLFRMTQEKLIAQELWERKLFNNSGYSALVVG